MESADTNLPRILFTATTPGGDTLRLVAMPGGACGIYRNQSLIPERQWAACPMGEATDELLRLAGLDPSP